MSIRMAVVNDYEVVVRGVTAMLRSYTDRIEVVEYDAGAAVATPVDIALYDSFAQPRGDRSQSRLVGNPQVGKVVVYSWNLDPLTARKSLQLGACGYVSKQLPAAELVAALEAVHRGEVVVSRHTGSRATSGGDWPGREEGLTERESEVLALISQGLTNQEITEQTGLSINSVKSYIRTAYRKIGVTSRSRAVLWGVEHGFQPDRVRVVDQDAAGDD